MLDHALRAHGQVPVRQLAMNVKLSPHLQMQMEMEMEVKASEREGGRLHPGEIDADLRKLAAHREEIADRRGRAGLPPEDLYQVAVVVDTAPAAGERMTSRALAEVQEWAAHHEIHLCYLSAERAVF